jgi:hypothetical protein
LFHPAFGDETILSRTKPFSGFGADVLKRVLLNNLPQQDPPKAVE